MLSIEEFKKKLGGEVNKHSEEELIKLKEDMDGLANFLLNEYVDKSKNKNES